LSFDKAIDTNVASTVYRPIRRVSFEEEEEEEEFICQVLQQ